MFAVYKVGTGSRVKENVPSYITHLCYDSNSTRNDQPNHTFNIHNSSNICKPFSEYQGAGKFTRIIIKTGWCTTITD